MHLDNKYTPADLDLEQFVDVTTDYANDWIQAYFNAAYRTVCKCGCVAITFMQRCILNLDILQLNVKEYQQNDLEKYLKRFERIYSVHKGPYAAGQEV